MNISRFSVHRPIFTIMVTLIVMILGAVSLYRIPVDLMPDVTSPTLSVSTSYENASPAEIEELITRPVEEAMSAVPGVEEVTSVSSEGNSNVRITFSWGTDLDAAANDIRDRLDRVIPRLPDEADRPTLRKFDLASFPIMMVGASSRLDPVVMRKIIDDQVKYRIERVPGVAALDVWGGQEREIHVRLDPDKIKALGISLDVLIKHIEAANVNLPAGNLEAGNYEMVVRTPGEYTNLDSLRETTVAIREGVSVRLKDVADIEDSWRKITRIVRFNGEPGIRMSVNKQSGKNTVQVARNVREEIKRINLDIPQIQITPIMDTSDYIRRSITNVGRSAMYGGIFAILVLLLFLRNMRSTAIIATAIPISIIATFMMIYFGGFTLNLMTLGGLALGVGMLVDNSIAVLENIYRLRETDHKLSGEEGAVHGAEEVLTAIVASTLTTVVVFLPMIFVRGMAGVMFRQLAYVISFALFCSMGIALTLVPMLASRFLHPTSLSATANETITHRIFRITGRFLEKIESRYKSFLHFALNHRLWVVASAILLLVSSIALIPLVGTELMPAADEGQVRINVEMEVGTKLSLLDETFRPIEKIVVREVPEAKNTVVNLGGSSWRSGGSHKGDMIINLKPLGERTRSSEEIAFVLRKKLVAIPGAVIRTRAGQGLFVLRMASGDADRLQVEVRGYDLETADALAQRVRGIVETVDGITDVRLSRDSGQPERLIVVDRAKAEAMKVSVSQVAGMLQTVLGGTRAGYYREGGDEYAILIKLKDAEKRSLREILDLTLTNSEGDQVVLRNIVNVQARTGPVSIERKDQERIVRVEANVHGRDMGSIIADIRDRLRSVPIPGDFSIGFAGDYEEQQKAFQELGLGLILALILVYMVMACQYESLKDPLVIMFSVPMAVIGVVLMLLLSNTTFNVQSYIGCIMLSGIVVNNAILLVDHTNLLRRRDGMGIREAIEEAGRRRLRPILMTALTTSLGLTPLALGFGEGGEAQAPLARAVIGGLMSSTLLTLIFVPVVYSLFEAGWRSHAKKAH
ncbi:MAG: efflux RND transporter permease subunit [Lentisphaerae bacterium]|nr:efflux RND transporter permease subunit [Lentisphaerota bacterium]